MPRKAKEKVVENEILNEKNKEIKDDKKAKKTKASTTKKAPSATTKKAGSSAAKKSTASTSKKAATPKKSAAEKKPAVKKASSTEKKATTKKTTSTKKKSTTKKAPSKKTSEKEPVKKSTTKKVSEKKSSTKKTSEEKAATSKATTKKTTTKKTTTKKTTTTKSTARKTTTRKSSKKAEPVAEENIQILEYYDLPYKYGNTIVKLLAQTPKTLFVYWEISDEDVENFKQKYGDDFFNITKPILIVHNLTLNKTSEVEINDFANCWYLNTEDADCKFDIELARKFISDKSSKSKKAKNDYLYVAKSNELQAPNDHIMFEKLTTEVTFKNYKTDEDITENIESFKFLKDIYKFYQDMYKDELLKNPSSKF